MDEFRTGYYKPTHVIRTVTHNWFWSPSENSEGYVKFVVGEKGVVEIIEHVAGGEGDKWYYDIVFEDDSVTRLFNPNEVTFEKIKTES